jgi:hypothetical protein
VPVRPVPPTPVRGVCVDDLELAVLDGIDRFDDGSVSPAHLWHVLDAADRVEDLSDHDQLELVEAWRRLEAAAVARRLHRTAAFALTPVGGSGIGPQVREFADDELALRTRAPRGTASRDLATALRLRDALPGCANALRAGRLDLARATRLASGSESLTVSQCQQLETRVLVRAVQQDARGLRNTVARAVLAIDPDRAESRRRRATDERCISARPVEDGMVHVFARLTGLDWVTISSAINAAARAIKTGGDERTLEQLRADALVAPFAKALRTGTLDGLEPITLAQHRGLAPNVNVTVSLATLIGASEQPGELDGYGPITAAHARELAACGRWRRILTDPVSGAVVDVGTATYSPPAAMARLVEARDATCRFPGCTVTAQRCDLDHTTPFPAGPTAVNNLGALCRRHHRLKHELPGSSLVQTEDGTFTWTLPTGHHYTDHPWAGADPPDE